MRKATRALTAFLVLSLLFASAVAWSGGQGDTAQTKFVAKYTDSDPPGGVRTKFVAEYFLPEITKQTNGRMTFQDFWGGALLGPPESLKGIGDGVADFGFVFPEFYPKQLPVHQIFKLFPAGPGKWSTLKWVYEKAYAEIPELKAELAAWNQIPLLTTAGLPGAFCATYPIDSIDDLKGKKWRASSRWVLEYLRNAGAVPVSVPWADCYMALQTGTIDGVLTNLDGAHMTKLDEAGPNVMVDKQMWWATPFVHTVNVNYWNKLPEDIQKAILKASENAMKDFGAAFDAAYDEIIAAQKKAGYTVTGISQADRVKWENEPELVKLQAKWVEEAKAAGLGNADQIMAKMKAIMKEAMAMDAK